jgi:cysteine desulfurase
MIYFDHNATTPMDERVLEAMLPYLNTYYGNPSALYRQGRLVRSAIDTAREQVASLAGASPSQIIFTSGGTEANNLALASTAPCRGLAVSAVEHPSVAEPAEHLRNEKHALTVIEVNSDGLIEQDGIDKMLEHKPGLVSMMLANNETGVVQDVARYAEQLRDKQIIVHTDAVQAAGKIPVDFTRLGVHLMTLSSHKIYGPKGCGALVFDKSAEIKPIIRGGGQEQGFRAGTENPAAIVGFGKAAELASAELAERNEHLRVLRGRLEIELSSIPGLIIFARAAERLPNTVQFGLPETDGEMLLMKLDQKGIAVSSGSACASGGKEPSPVLTAMGVASGLAMSAIRISLGKSNTEAEIFSFIKILKTLVPS